MLIGSQFESPIISNDTLSAERHIDAVIAEVTDSSTTYLVED
jgi:hypothetical protein